MAEIICPICSKINDADAVNCQHCQAELKRPDIPPGQDNDLGSTETPQGNASEGLQPENIFDFSEEKPDQPLSDLNGILPVQTAVTEITKPQPYSARLRIHEGQVSHARLMQEMVAKEHLGSAVVSRRQMVSQNIMRLLIAVVLLIGISWSLISASPTFNLPEITSETQTINQYIQEAPPDAPVLVVFDYEPGLSDEMETVAAAPINQLLVQNTYLVLVSTSPTGPVLAEHFIQRLSAQTNNTYKAGEDYLNLGFIPGGETGLSSFAVSPRTTMPFALDGNAAWNHPNIQSIGTLADFNLLILITDNSDNARDWIEQIEPSLAQTPFLTVLSAQAEPFTRPYYGGPGSVSDQANEQVDGMISGMRGGIEFERLNGRLALASRTWTAYMMAILISAVLILLGALINALVASSTGDQPN